MGFGGSRSLAIKNGFDSRMPSRLAGISRRGWFASMLMIGAMVAILGVTLVPVQDAEARPTFTGGGCGKTSPTEGCHDGGQVPTMMAISGLPTTGNYVPGQPYNVQITITDTNGASTGMNAFDMLISAGTLSTTDSNVEIVSASSEAKANDAVDLKVVTVFNLVWTAPLSGSASIEIWGIMGDGAGSTHDIWDRETFSYSQIPEFPVILLPIVGVGLAVLLASRLAKR